MLIFRMNSSGIGLSQHTFSKYQQSELLLSLKMFVQVYSASLLQFNHRVISQMQYSKEQLSKRRHIESSPKFNLKSMFFHGPQTSTPDRNKGKVKIQQYQYDEQNKLGQGFTSKVYLGHKVNDVNNQYAIKVIDKRKLSRSKQNLDLLKQEMFIHKQLDHPNIVKCYDIIEKINFYYFVLEYCPHGTLDHFIKKHQKLTESTTITIMEQIVTGYKYLMKQKIIHRDLKPPNILKSGANWKICDFGFSVIGKKNLVGEINVGTPAYMAPQALERTYYSPKTDFFSLGVLCYEMLFGSTPWQHKNQKILLQMIKETKIKQQLMDSIKNSNLVLFIKKCCLSNQRKRMSQQQFQDFCFWKEQTKKEELPQPQPLKQPNSQESNQANPLMHTNKFTTKDDPSTCYSKTSQRSNNTSVIGEKKQRKMSVQQLFQGNIITLERQMYYATLIYILLKNNSYLLFEQAEEKELFMCLLIKHAIYIIRRIKHSKVNYLNLKKWQEFCISQTYLKIMSQASDLQTKMQDIVSKEIKRRSIIIIRQINSKFEELDYDKQLSTTCLNHLKTYLIQLMKRVTSKFESVGGNYIKQNVWTSKVLEYLLKYFKHLDQLSLATQQSRSIIIKRQLKDRSYLEEDLGQPKMRCQEFHCLKQQINGLSV